MRLSAKDGASRHSPNITAPPATTNNTAPTMKESVTPTSAPSSSAGSTAARAHSVMARRRLAATSAGKIWGAPRVGSTYSGSRGGGGASATEERGGPLRGRDPERDCDRLPPPRPEP